MKYQFIFYLLFIFQFKSIGQENTLKMGLTELVQMAKKEAPAVQISKTKLSNRYWLYQSYLSDLKPQIGLNATLPNLNRNIESIILPDGTQAFVPRSFMQNSVGITLDQEIGLTAGRIFAFTGLERIDIFKTDLTNKNSSFLSTPIIIGFQQPLFGFNRLKWAKEIEPLKYDEATRQHLEEMELIAFQTTNLFFDVLISQLNAEALEIRKANADTLLEISKGRFEVGRIAETELLQVELSAMNTNADLANSQLSLLNNTERLRNFLGIKKAVKFDLIPPSSLPEFIINIDDALAYANKYRSESIAFQKRLKEVEQALDLAKSQNGLQADITGRFGLSQTAPNFQDAFSSLNDQEQFQISLNIPIADWGKSKSRLEIARSNQELEQMNVAQERINFTEEINSKVQQFDLLRNQVSLAKRAFDVSKKKLDITRKRYLIGKIRVLELNLAIKDQDESRRAYFFALRSFWTAYYELRGLTLYDFENQQALIE